jgi:hypothetical protein
LTRASPLKVSANTISSERDPKLRIRLPRSVQYAGADRSELYGVADCELHAFVDADARHNVRRLYWVPFEGYLPSKSGLAYRQGSPRHAAIGGLDFYVDTWVRADGGETRPGSDREHVEALLRSRGLRVPLGRMYVRLVHLLDEGKRKEPMIIFSEDLAAAGFAAADLQENGKAGDRWPPLEKGLLERAEAAIAISRP